MSAIAGIVCGDGHDLDTAVLRQMAASTHRPAADGVSFWQEGPAGLVRFHHATTVEGMREAALRESSGAVICFDGRIDNRAEILARLGDKRAAGSSDGDVVLALFERYGDAFLKDLVGDFALAIWQPHLRRLFCARSPMGWRPLLWTRVGTRLAFASEPAALIKGLGLTPHLNEGLIGEVLSTRFVSPDETFWLGVYRLAPGNALAFQDGTLRCWRWYEDRYEDFSHLSDADHIAQFQALFDQALIACTRSNGAVAAHLSGGLDSSSVFARATELYRSGAISAKIGAVSVRYPGEPQDETAWSSAVEQHLGITARVVGDIPYDLDVARAWCAQTLHLPVRPNTSGPTQSVCTLMQGLGERVLLTGEGGDDWLNGSYAHWPDLFRSGQWGRLLGEGFSSASERSFWQSLRSVLGGSLGPILSRTRRNRLKVPFRDLDAPMPIWVKAEWAKEIGLQERWRAAVPTTDFPNFAQMPRQAAMAMPYRSLIFDPIVANAAQYGVEFRHPLHDLRLVRFLIGAAGNMLRRDGVYKYLLREAMRGTLPEIVRTRQTKAQFSAPIIDAMTQYFAQKRPQDMLAVQRGWIDGATITRLFEEQRHWRQTGSSGTFPNGALAGLWFCVSVDLWLENAFKR